MRCLSICIQAVQECQSCLTSASAEQHSLIDHDRGDCRGIPALLLREHPLAAASRRDLLQALAVRPSQVGADCPPSISSIIGINNITVSTLAI